MTAPGAVAACGDDAVGQEGAAHRGAEDTEGGEGGGSGMKYRLAVSKSGDLVSSHECADSSHVAAVLAIVLTWGGVFDGLARPSDRISIDVDFNFHRDDEEDAPA